MFYFLFLSYQKPLFDLHVWILRGRSNDQLSIKIESAILNTNILYTPFCIVIYSALFIIGYVTNTDFYLNITS